MLRSPLLHVALGYVVLCAALWPFPVVGMLHVHAGAIVAGVGFFASGLAALALFRRGAPLGRTLAALTGLLALPLALLALAMLWRPNCAWAQGLLLFLVFTGPSVALAVALAYALDALLPRGRRAAFVLVGFALALLPVAYDLGLHPQFYTYNHVWGGVLGPIYDEELAVRPGLFFFRGLTLWWAVWLVVLGRRARLRRDPSRSEDAVREGRRLGWVLLGVSGLIGATYLAAPWLGINTPAWYLQRQLGGHLALDRFDVYYDPASLTEQELAVVADVHRFRYAQLREALGVDVPVRIATYLYPDAETKARLTGARHTAVAPTWLPTPQIHVLAERFENSFAHELAHVVAREFGMPVLRASPAVGLVEGLAVALEPPDGRPGLHAQVAAALQQREALGVYGGSLAESVARKLSPLGFWTARGAVSYTTMGSFVRYLLDGYGPEPVRAAYRTGRFRQAFGRPVRELAEEWERFIRRQPVDPEAEALVAARFAVPSLFELRCPHYVPPVVRHVRAGREALERGEVDAAEAAFAAALAADSTNQAALVEWARLALARGDVEAVRARLAAVPEAWAGPALLARLADAHRLAGDEAAADSSYARARARVPRFARTAYANLRIRQALGPEELAVALAPEPPEVRAARLERLPGAAPLMAALLWAEAGDPARALAAVERPRANVLPELAADRLAWQAALAHRAGDRARAAVFAEEAARAYDEQGLAAAAERERDRLALLQWILLNGA